MMLTSADGSGCPLAESVTTPVTSAFSPRTGFACATPVDNKRVPAAMKARARPRPMRDRMENMNCLDKSVEFPPREFDGGPDFRLPRRWTSRWWLRFYRGRARETEGAVVFLVYSRALRSTVGFDMRPNRS